MSDPIADMLTRVRNANRVGKAYVDVLASKSVRGIAGVLKDEGYIRDFDEIEDNRQGIIRIHLKYGPAGEMVISRLQRASRPGRRLYRRSKDIPVVLGGLGIAILSTNQGVMSDRQARQKKVGGELICTVY